MLRESMNLSDDVLEELQSEEDLWRETELMVSDDADLTHVPLTREEVKEAQTFTRQQILSTVSLFYDIQKIRIKAHNKGDAIKRNVTPIADTGILAALKANLEKVEADAARAMKAYVKMQPLGQWCTSILGLSHTMTAPLLAFIDLQRCCCAQYRHLKSHEIPEHDGCPGLVTAGAIWKYAGLDPTIKWEKGGIRPYNARLKRLMWLIGSSFKRVTGLKSYKENPNREDALYTRLYVQRKLQEVEKNERGDFAAQAHARLQSAIKGKWNISPEQKAAWSAGRLQAVGLDLRAMRYSVKIFLSHYHHVGRTLLGLPVVKPWVLEHGGHAHYIPPPCFPFKAETPKVVVATTADVPLNEKAKKKPAKKGRKKK